MSSFSIVTLIFGALTLIVGVAALIGRRRLYRFVIRRFETIYREDGLGDKEIERRRPSIRVVILLALGVMGVSIVFFCAGLLL